VIESRVGAWSPSSRPSASACAKPSGEKLSTDLAIRPSGFASNRAWITGCNSSIAAAKDGGRESLSLTSAAAGAGGQAEVSSWSGVGGAVSFSLAASPYSVSVLVNTPARA